MALLFGGGLPILMQHAILPVSSAELEHFIGRPRRCWRIRIFDFDQGRLIRANRRYSFLLPSHVSNDRLYFVSLLDSICKKSQ
jgi:hypothetical protein